MESCKGDMHIDSSEDGDDGDDDVFYSPKCGGISSFPENGLKTTYEIDWTEKSIFPAGYINKENMKIKDVAKTHILPFLPAKSLLKSRAVSKEWNRWIVSPLLAFQQSILFQKLSGYFYQTVDGDYISKPDFLSVDSLADGVPSPSLSFLPERVKILCSSSGLLLCEGLTENYFVCNPATENWKCIPRHQYFHGHDPAAVLAFDPDQSNIESYYHIIVAVPLLDQPVVNFEIYSSATNSWKCSSSDCVELEYPSLSGGGFYMEGVAYWNTSSNEILAFDLKNEIPAVLRVPTLETGQHGALTMIADEIFYVTAYNDCGNVFVIDLYGGTGVSLMRSVSVNLGHKKRLTSFTSSSHDTMVCEVLPCIDSDTVVIHTSENIYLYRLRDQKIDTLKSPGPPKPFRRFLPYTNSLVALHDLHK